MTNSTRIVHLLAGTACAAIVLAGCSNRTEGTPTPTTATGAASGSAASADVFANLNACQVLNQVLAGQGFNPGERKTTRNECDALKSGYGTYSLTLDSVQGLAEFEERNSGVEKIAINGRNAMQANTGIGGGCAVAIEVSARTRAMVVVNMSSSSQDSQACPNAKQFAEQVEPLLPKAQ